MTSKNFKINDLVWAKMKGYPHWPGRIIEPPAEIKMKKKHYCVSFYVTNNYSVLHEQFIEPHSREMIRKIKNVKNKLFHEAVQIIKQEKKDAKQSSIKKVTENKKTNRSASAQKNSERKNTLHEAEQLFKLKKKPDGNSDHVDNLHAAIAIKNDNKKESNAKEKSPHLKALCKPNKAVKSPKKFDLHKTKIKKEKKINNILLRKAMQFIAGGKKDREQPSVKKITEIRATSEETITKEAVEKNDCTGADKISKKEFLQKAEPHPVNLRKGSQDDSKSTGDICTLVPAIIKEEEHESSTHNSNNKLTDIPVTIKEECSKHNSNNELTNICKNIPVMIKEEDVSLTLNSNNELTVKEENQVKEFPKPDIDCMPATDILPAEAPTSKSCRVMYLKDGQKVIVNADDFYIMRKCYIFQ